MRSGFLSLFGEWWRDSNSEWLLQSEVLLIQQMVVIQAAQHISQSKAHNICCLAISLVHCTLPHKGVPHV